MQIQPQNPCINLSNLPTIYPLYCKYIFLKLSSVQHNQLGPAVECNKVNLLKYYILYTFQISH